VVSYFSSTAKLDDLPHFFDFTGRIIFCVNDLPKDADMEALLTRALVYDLDLDLNTVKKLIMAIAKSTKETNLSEAERVEVAEYLCENCNEATPINLRTLIMALKSKEFANSKGLDWKLEVNVLIKPDEDKLLIKQMLGKYTTKQEAKRAWCQETGYSPAQFQRLLRTMGLSRHYSTA